MTTRKDTRTEFRGLHPIFRALCSKDIRSFSLGSPFVVGEFVWASDTRVLVRCSLARFDKQPLRAEWTRGRRLPNVEAAWAMAGAVADTPTPIPEGLTKTETCNQCGGGGKVHCNYDHEHDCPECNGDGEVKRRYPAEVGPERFAEYLLALLLENGVCELFLAKEIGKAAFFRGDGFEGLVVPLRPKQQAEPWSESKVAVLVARADAALFHPRDARLTWE